MKEEICKLLYGIPFFTTGSDISAPTVSLHLSKSCLLLVMIYRAEAIKKANGVHFPEEVINTRTSVV